MKHANIAIFIPHSGCPCQCSFCNQKKITGSSKQPTPYEVAEILQTAACSLGEGVKNTEIAYFGGSFTAIDRGYMLSLLETAQAAVKKWGLGGIRISTRPDAIDGEILALLKQYGVTAVELGAQSMSDRVLALNKRGHDSLCVERASGQIKKTGFQLGLQLMTGLYGSDDETDYASAVKITELVPDTVRIYPTVVLEDTELCNLYRTGAYTPQSLQSAVALCARMLSLFGQKDIRVIRTGLHATDELVNRRVAGPYHPAFKELCLSRLFLQRLLLSLEDRGQKCARVWVNPKQLSVALGQKRENMNILAGLGYDIVLTAKEGIQDFEITEREQG